MKSHLLILSALVTALSLSSCADSTGRSRVNLVNTGRLTSSTPGVIGQLYTVNGVALQHYDPSLYTPFVYDHRGLAHNTYYQQQELRASRRGSVHVGPMTVEHSDE